MDKNLGRLPARKRSSEVQAGLTAPTNGVPRIRSFTREQKAIQATDQRSLSRSYKRNRLRHCNHYPAYPQEVQNREFKEENELNKILLEKKENRLEGLQKKLLVERITEKLWFKCLNNTLKILDSAIITCFMKFYKDDSIRMSFEEIGNVISEELSMLEERFVVVDFSRFILYRYLGDSIPELHFNFKDLREVYFHVDLLMIKITYIARGSMFQLTERDVFLICANFFDFEKWLTLLAPLIRKYISNEQLVLGLRDEEDFNKNDRSIEKEIPIGIPDSSLDDEVKLGIEDGNEEIPGMIRTHFERKRVEINKVLDDVSTEINELFTSSIVYNDRFGAMTHSDQEQMKSTQLSSQRKSVKKSIKKF